MASVWRKPVRYPANCSRWRKLDWAPQVAAGNSQRGPSAGGIWDKLGNRFETRWTIRSLIDLLDGSALAVLLETTGDEGFEFTVERPPGLDHHQCKRQLASGKDWRISDLDAVLERFGKQLRDASSTCVFASTASAAQLQGLVLRAGPTDSAERFESEFAAPAIWKSAVSQLRGYWQEPTSRELWDRLRRRRIQTIDEESLVELNRARLAVRVDAAAEEASRVLFNMPTTG